MAESRQDSEFNSPYKFRSSTPRLITLVKYCFLFTARSGSHAAAKKDEEE